MCNITFGDYFLLFGTYEAIIFKMVVFICRNCSPDCFTINSLSYLGNFHFAKIAFLIAMTYHLMAVTIKSAAISA